MTIQITIIGLGQIGTSIGLALGSHQEQYIRLGHDIELPIARQAEKLGAVDKVSTNLFKAIQDADIILLTMPIDQIHETIKLIASDMKKDVVVIDTGPDKQATIALVEELFPKDRHYVGIIPVINASFLYPAPEAGIKAADAELFKGGLMAIVSPPGTISAAIKLASDLTEMVGATVIFADPVELDSLLASTYQLPQLLAAALLDATVDKPGWLEGRKIAGKEYAQATAPISSPGNSRSMQSSILNNCDNITRVINNIIASLVEIRDNIETQDGNALNELFERALQSRQKWWRERQSVDALLSDEIPRIDYSASPGFFKRFIGLNRKPKDKK